MTGPCNPQRPPLSVPDAEMISRTRHLGWDAATLEEAHDLRQAALRHGLSPEHSDKDGAIRRAALVGMAVGLVLGAVTLIVALTIRDAINSHWPVACDGTSAIASCAVKIIGTRT